MSNFPRLSLDLLRGKIELFASEAQIEISLFGMNS